ncbi:unnamed protein product [Nezara viridula]|uniref:Major facilitator superfamily (MFS) profile domain-containing protein n=1 Tax=Nezara viridula TaxID=85310 RepID=A0A9P0HDN4_NEZVI|nr:unnamed protein product [Nezara viridula]
MTRKYHTKMVPPDGGWGWIIVLGSSIMDITTYAIEPSFGLLFGDLLKQLGVETTGASLVMSTMDGIFNFSGLFVGPLTKKYSYRKVAILGAVLSTAAFLLTAPANSLLHILITYGVLGGHLMIFAQARDCQHVLPTHHLHFHQLRHCTDDGLVIMIMKGIGFGLANSSTLVGINKYFSKKKGQAVGIAMAGTAVGFMLMPQIVRFLLDEYGFRSALLILGAISLHAVEVEEEDVHSLLPSDKKDSSATTDTKSGLALPDHEQQAITGRGRIVSGAAILKNTPESPKTATVTRRVCAASKYAQPLPHHSGDT